MLIVMAAQQDQQQQDQAVRMLTVTAVQQDLAVVRVCIQVVECVLAVLVWAAVCEAAA